MSIASDSEDVSSAYANRKFYGYRNCQVDGVCD